MLNKIRVSPGTYVEIVPLGLLCTLQYNDAGILQRIIMNLDEINHTDSDVMLSDLVIQLKKDKVVPQRIPFKQGTTWVKGVLYSKKLPKTDGILPQCLYKDIINDLKSNDKDYTFYAGNLKNDSFNFLGSSMIATRLHTFGFNVLPGYMIYDIKDVLPIHEVMRSNKSPFEFPLISGLMIYDHGTKYRYVPMNLYQDRVAATDNYLDPHGYQYTAVKCRSKRVDIPYCDTVNLDIQLKSDIIIDENRVVYSRKGSGLFRQKLTRSKHCSVCGKLIQVPIKGNTCCSDPHCSSKLYPIIQHFTRTLLLPEMSYQDFEEHVRNKEITCLIDILLLDEYKNIQISCTLSNLLFAMVPFELCRGVQFFQEFVNYLGSVEALDYYIQNPDAIATDLKLNPVHAKNFADWLKDSYNSVELETLLKSDQIKIKSVSKKFEGAPIFRNKTICITGDFKHGTLEDIVSILQSYSAKVVTKFDNTVNCVVIGHFENEDPQIAQLATSYNVPIYSEDSFFKSYEIDLDIKKQVDSLTSYLK